jgi:hypothetical protein
MKRDERTERLVNMGKSRGGRATLVIKDKSKYNRKQKHKKGWN